MSIHVSCPNGHVLRVKDSLAGKMGYCPHCRAKVHVPLTQFPEEDVMSILGPPPPVPPGASESDSDASVQAQTATGGCDVSSRQGAEELVAAHHREEVKPASPTGSLPDEDSAGRVQDDLSRPSSTRGHTLPIICIAAVGAFALLTMAIVGACGLGFWRALLATGYIGFILAPALAGIITGHGLLFKLSSRLFGVNLSIRDALVILFVTSFLASLAGSVVAIIIGCLGVLSTPSDLLWVSVPMLFVGGVSCSHMMEIDSLAGIGIYFVYNLFTLPCTPIYFMFAFLCGLLIEML